MSIKKLLLLYTLLKSIPNELKREKEMDVVSVKSIKLVFNREKERGREGERVMFIVVGRKIDRFKRFND
jgi:hypothetical protein